MSVSASRFDLDYKRILDDLPDAVAVFGGDGDFGLKYLNMAGLLLAGIPEAAVASKTLLDINTGFDSKEAFQHSVEPLFSGEKSYVVVETTRRDGNGGAIPMEVKLQLLRSDGAPPEFMSVTRELVERTTADMERDRFKRALDQTLDAVFMYNADDLRFVYVNEGARQQVGYSEEELMKMTILDIKSRFTAASFRELIAPLLRGEQRSIRFETSHRHKTGAECPVEVYLQLVQERDGERRFVNIVRDISERRRAEVAAELHARQLEETNQQLTRAKVQAEEASQTKTAFLSNMSHEIRTPLNAILGYAQLMMRDTQLSADSKKHLQVITRSGDHLLQLLNSVLDMSKIEAGHTELHRVTFSFMTLLENLEAMFRLRCEAKGLRLEIHQDSNGLPYLAADEGKVRQILVNLLNNAVKFTDRGSVQLRIDLVDRDGQLWLLAMVQDSGCGIRAAEREKMFKPFSQTHGGLSTGQGTGLGLAISRTFAQLMGGDLCLESSSEAGSVFRFEVPVQRADLNIMRPPAKAGRIRGLAKGSPTPRILVADDQTENRELMQEWLTRLGFEVQTANDGMAAVRRWEEWNPQLVLMDVHMPVMSGLEATQAIKSRGEGQETVVIALTADAMNENRSPVMKAGVDDFIGKPWHEDELLDKLARHLKVAFEHEKQDGDEDGATETKDPGAFTAEDLRRLPLELLTDLRAATLSGSRGRMNRVIHEIATAHDAGLGEFLKHMADNYQHDRLTGLLNICLP